MARISYQPKTFSPAHRQVIDAANAICAEYAPHGISLTSRQLYYRFVARGLLPNRQQESKRLMSILNDARMAGEMDWEYLVDRTRSFAAPTRWDSPAHFIAEAAVTYQADLWAPQRQRVQVWVEKDAAIGAVEGVCDQNAVPRFSCRGYLSLSEARSAAGQIRRDIQSGNQVTILYVGDHDPAGLDMSRAIGEQLRLFIAKEWLAAWKQEITSSVAPSAVEGHMREHMRQRGTRITDDQDPWCIKRIALNRDQVERHSPPPNPVRTTDTRLRAYVEETGLTESWELDALDPIVLRGLIQGEIDQLRDGEAWAASHAATEAGRKVLARLGAEWDQVQRSLQTGSESAD